MNFIRRLFKKACPPYWFHCWHNTHKTYTTYKRRIQGQAPHGCKADYSYEQEFRREDCCRCEASRELAIDRGLEL